MENQAVKKKEIFIYERVYRLFFFTGIIALCVALFFKSGFPESYFNLSVYNMEFSISNSRIWFVFTAYLFVLTILYFIISKTKLKTKKWLVISHYVFIILFLVFFAVFSSMSNEGVQKLLSDIPLITIITIYGIVFLIDVVFFTLSILLLLINILTLKKKGSNQ